MPSTHGSRAIAFLAALALSTACVTTRLPPISNAGSQFRPLEDELKLWELSRDEEKKLRDNVILYQDPLLEEYLEEVTAWLNPVEMAANPEIGYRVRVIEDPTLNAFTYSHGSIYVHTGLLARMENEDQLARRIDAATAHVPLERLALSPQCGFASVAGGNPLSEEEQMRKLDLVVRVAERVWGDI